MPSRSLLAPGPLFLLASALACAGTTAPRLLQHRALDAGSARVLFLVATREKPEIAAHLQAAGFELAERLIDAPFLLRATLGVPQGFRSCGDNRNVKFALQRDGRALLELSARGWTGSCEPSIYDSLSAQLGAVFDEAARRSAQE